MIRPDVRRLFHLRLRRPDLAAEDTHEEIEVHLAERAAQLERLGMAPEAARAEALRRFGPIEPARRRLVHAARSRDRRLGVRDRLDELGQDLRYAWRSLRNEPGVAAVVVLLIALGVGANAAMFGILDRLLLRGPEHVRESRNVARIYFTADVPGEGAFTASSFGYVAYRALHERNEAFTAVAAYASSPSLTVTLGRGGSAAEVLKADATWDLFPLLGATPALGRFFGRDEDRPGAAQRVVVLGDELWRARFAADPGILGRRVSLDGIPYTVIGVAPPGLTGVDLGRVDAWMPMSLRGPTVAEDWQTTLQAQWLRVVVRLAPGVTRERAGAEATAAFRDLFPAASDDPLAHARLSARPIRFDGRGSEATEAGVSRWLVGVSLVVLLVACANVANLLLARAVRRQREVAVRVALGISRARLVRLLLAQSLLLAGIGGLLALAVVPFTGGLLRTTLLPNVDWSHSPLDGRVVLVALGLTLLTGVLTGLAPALPAHRGDLLAALRSGVREGGGRSSRLRSGLTVVQAAFSVLLLVAAGLFMRSLWRAESLDLGIEPERVLVAGAHWVGSTAGSLIRPSGEGREQAFYARALEAVRRMPDVASAAITVGTPFHSSFTVDLRVPGWGSVPALPGGGPYIQAVSSGYFPTVGLRLLRGRGFGDGDRAGSEPVAVVNETMAATLWPRAEPLDNCLYLNEDVHAGATTSCTRVVGVVEDAYRDSLEDKPAMQYYVPLGQEEGFGGTCLLVRPRGKLAAVVEPLRRTLRAVDPSALRIDVDPLQEGLEPEIRPWRLGATLIGGFGALALLIAAIGLYSLIAHMVASRTHELGVRVALGARGSDVMGLVLGRGLRLAALGLTLGVALALAAGPRLGGLLFHTSPRDPLVYLAVVGGLLAAATAACVVPARRALRVDPALALRDE